MMAFFLVLLIGGLVRARQCLDQETSCLDHGLGGAGQCVEEEEDKMEEEEEDKMEEEDMGVNSLDRSAMGECWEEEEAGFALRAWVLAEGGGDRQEVLHQVPSEE